MEKTKVVIPGDILDKENRSKGEDGTYTIGEAVYASTVGIVKYKKSPVQAMHVISHKPLARVPQINDIVWCRVTKITQHRVHVQIIAVEGVDTMLSRQIIQFFGIIRSTDIRNFEVDTVRIVDSFQPGDIVRAKVLAFGDIRSYYLSTAQNDFGVIVSISPIHKPMVPISWEAVQCPVTFICEKRKVANIDLCHLNSVFMGADNDEKDMDT